MIESMGHEKVSMGNGKAQFVLAKQQMEKTVRAGSQTDKQGSLYYQPKAL